MITEREKALWDLLDEIDTAFDALRPRIEAFEDFVQRQVDKRHLYLQSDGYQLYEPATLPPDQSKGIELP